MSDAGTITATAFTPAGHVAVAAYEGVDWLLASPKSALPNSASPSPEKLARGAAAVLSVAVSPDGAQVAAGCMDKCTRVWTLGTLGVANSSSSRSGGEEADADGTGGVIGAAAAAADGDGGGDGGGDDGGDGGEGSTEAEAEDRGKPKAKVAPRATDWVGFDGPVSAVEWSVGGRWLAMAGGTALLVAPRAGKKGEPPLLCRTPGVPEADGKGGSCGRFATLAWCKSREPLLAALEAGSGTRAAMGPFGGGGGSGGFGGRAFLFDVTLFDQGWPKQGESESGLQWGILSSSLLVGGSVPPPLPLTQHTVL